MRTVRIEDAAPGMKVARGISDGAGNLLLPQGAVLTVETLQRLRSRKVMSISVEEEESAAKPAAPGQTSNSAEKIEAELDALFSDVKGNPVMDAICAAAKSVLKSKKPG